jgi:hypothetical protein
VDLDVLWCLARAIVSRKPPGRRNTNSEWIMTKLVVYNDPIAQIREDYTRGEGLKSQGL